MRILFLSTVESEWRPQNQRYACPLEMSLIGYIPNHFGQTDWATVLLIDVLWLYGASHHYPKTEEAQNVGAMSLTAICSWSLGSPRDPGRRAYLGLVAIIEWPSRGFEA